VICELCGEPVSSLTNGACAACLATLASLQSNAGRPATTAPPSVTPSYGAAPAQSTSSANLSGTLAGKFAVVTGANRGIGRAIVERMLDNGADVHIIDIENSNYVEIERFANARQRRCSFSQADVTDDAAMVQIITGLASERGGIDILVNDAGVYHSGVFAKYSRRDWDHQFAVNVSAPFALSQTVVPFMPTKAGAVIINIASVAGKSGAPFSVGYVASKHAIVGLTRAMADDLAPVGINVNAIAPGFVDTDMLKQIMREVAPLAGDTGPDQTLSEYLAIIPQHRLVQPRDVAELAVFLASPAAASITGQIVNVSGGWLTY
jgi:NAD(P)-dependent dehydrogenase (short-subunit alcohol dehydrogenase family)